MGMLIALGALVVAVTGLIVLYNSMASLRIRTQEAWAGIDAQLKRRYDLIPNLVDTVKGYMAHERKAFEEVARLRAAAMGAATPEGKAQAEAGLSGALKTVFALAESYPELKSNTNFLSLQQSLSDVEDALQNARRYYNAVVRDYNTRLATFPGNMVAPAFGFHPAQFFEAPAAEKAVPKVSFQ